MTEHQHQPRVQPLSAPYPPGVEAALARWMPPQSAAEPLALFRTLHVNEELAGRMRPLGAGILGPTARVPPRLREVMIHRTCALTGAEYEWGVHAAAFAEPLGFTAEQLRSTVHGSCSDDCWDAAQSAVFRLADELHLAGDVSDELWEILRREYDEPELIELVVTAGWYHAIAYLCNALRVQPEPWARRFPPA